MAKTNSKKYLYLVVGLLILGGIAFGLIQGGLLEGKFKLSGVTELTLVNVESIVDAGEKAASAEENAADYATEAKTALKDTKSAYSKSNRTALTTAQASAEEAAGNARAQADLAEKYLEKANEIFDQYAEEYDEYMDGWEPLDALRDYTYEQFSDQVGDHDNPSNELLDDFKALYEADIDSEDCVLENDGDRVFCMTEAEALSDAWYDFCYDYDDDRMNGGKETCHVAQLDGYERLHYLYEEYLDAKEDLDEYEEENEPDFDYTEEKNNLADVKKSAENAEASATKAEGFASNAAAYKLYK